MKGAEKQAEIFPEDFKTHQKIALQGSAPPTRPGDVWTGHGNHEGKIESRNKSKGKEQKPRPPWRIRL
jgi:hypothetical protein